MPTVGIRQAIADAVDLLQSKRGSIGDDIIDALTKRLVFRDIFLSAAECPQYTDDPGMARRPWAAGITLLPAISKTHALGKPVDESFSVKLQRKLASTVPPRPIVKLGFEDAFGHLSRLFRDGKEVINVLDYTNSQCLLVSETGTSMYAAEAALTRDVQRHSSPYSRPRNPSRSSTYAAYCRPSSSTPWRCSAT